MVEREAMARPSCPWEVLAVAAVAEPQDALQHDTQACMSFII